MSYMFTNTSQTTFLSCLKARTGNASWRASFPKNLMLKGPYWKSYLGALGESLEVALYNVRKTQRASCTIEGGGSHIAKCRCTCAIGAWEVLGIHPVAVATTCHNPTSHSQPSAPSTLVPHLCWCCPYESETHWWTLAPWFLLSKLGPTDFQAKISIWKKTHRSQPAKRVKWVYTRKKVSIVRNVRTTKAACLNKPPNMLMLEASV